MLREDLAGGSSLALDDVVPTENCTLPAICHDLVLWSLHDGRVRLARVCWPPPSALCPPTRRCLPCSSEWTGVTFTPPACPYPGMVPFTAEWGYFYGRDADSAEAVDCLRRHPFLAIIGPSGSGKSSLLDAGILPALEKSHLLCPHALGRAQHASRRHTVYDAVVPARLAVRCLRWPTCSAAGRRSEHAPAVGGGPVRGAVHDGGGGSTQALRATPAACAGSARRACHSLRARRLLCQPDDLAAVAGDPRPPDGDHATARGRHCARPSPCRRAM